MSLIVYADRLGGSLPGLLDVLDGPLGGLFTGVHVLPFFARIDGADAGFDPEDHTAVDERLGTWADLTALAGRFDVVADLIVNHVSVRSPLFRDYVARGDRSEHAGMFLTLDGVFPEGVDERQLLALTRPRPGLPFTAVTLDGGRRRLMWTTFTPEQVDLDVGDPAARRYLTAVLERFAEAGVGTVRLDAVGYAVKTPGTSSFMTAETLAFVDDLTAEARRLGMEVLLEVHAQHDVQRGIAPHADLVYDFALPGLVLHALFAADLAPLRRWLDVRPANTITVLDTHDGIGVRDVVGLLTPAQIDGLVEGIHDRTGGASASATGAAAANVDLYQVNSTYYDALGRDDDAYVLARLLQLFVPGRPQIYYVGLLAGHNDVELLARTGVGRDVNRHHYSAGELQTALERPVVRAVCAAVRLRNEHPAFHGVCEVSGGDEERMRLAWRDEGGARAVLDADVAGLSYVLELTDADGTLRRVTDVRALAD